MMTVLVIGYTSGLGKYLHEYFKADGVHHHEPMPTKYYDLVIHCANNMDSPVANVRFIPQVLSIPCGMLVYCSTVEVYRVLAGECDNGYAASKLECETLVRQYTDSYQILRLGALLGPGMRPNSLLRLMSKERVSLTEESTFGYVRYERVANAIQNRHRGHSTEVLCGTPITLGEAASIAKVAKPQYGAYTYVTPQVRGAFDGAHELMAFLAMEAK